MNQSTNRYQEFQISQNQQGYTAKGGKIEKNILYTPTYYTVYNYSKNIRQGSARCTFTCLISLVATLRDLPQVSNTCCPRSVIMLLVPKVPKGQEIWRQGPFSSPQVLMINDDFIPQLIREDGQILLNKVPQLVLIQGIRLGQL